MKKTAILLIFFLVSSFAFKAYSQISVTSYSVYAFGFNTNQDKKINFELKAFANRSIDDLVFEPAVFYNFKAQPYHKVALGLGVNISNDETAVTIPFDIEIMPLQEFKRLSFIMELCPEIYSESDPSLRWLWGIRYRFGERN